MATLTWVGGGNNKANNPQDWSPAQVPVFGDTLIMPDGMMDISGNQLKGNTLQVGTSQFSLRTTTSNLDLSKHADVSITQPLITNGSDFVTNINSKGNNALNLDAPSGAAPINVRTFNVDIGSGTLEGSFTTDYSTVEIRGNGKLDNEKSTFAGSSALISTDVVGHGSFDVTALPTFEGVNVNGFLEFGDKVSAGETITVGHTFASEVRQWDTVKIDEPKDFHGSIAMEPSAEVDLVGFGNADGYKLQDDRLQFISGHHVIGTLKLANESSANLVVSIDGKDAYVTQQGLSDPPLGSTTLTQDTSQEFACSHLLGPVQQNNYITSNFRLSSSAILLETVAQPHVLFPLAACRS